MCLPLSVFEDSVPSASNLPASLLQLCYNRENVQKEVEVCFEECCPPGIRRTQ